MVKLERKYQELHTRQSQILQQRYDACLQEHRTMTLKQTQMSPLVVCVLDKFASGGGLLNVHAGQDVSFSLQVKYSLSAHLGEGGADLRRWIDDCPNSLYSALTPSATCGRAAATATTSA